VRAQVGSLRAEWLAEERTQVVGTFPPRKRGWTGLVEKDTAGQTNIYSVEVIILALFLHSNALASLRCLAYRFCDHWCPAVSDDL
jgi:hypothetical protein